MNILFINYTYPNQFGGGTEKAITNIAKYLTNKKFQLFVCYTDGSESVNPYIKRSCKLESSSNNYENLNQFIEENSIGVVINFKKYLNKNLIKVIHNKDIKLISSLRYAPQDTIAKLTTMLTISSKNRDLKIWLKKKFYKIYIRYAKYSSNKSLIRTIRASDKYVITSFRYKAELEKIGFASTLKNKLIVIPNMLSYNISIDRNQIDSKLNKVLIVGRLEEKSKRITIALRIWNQIFLKSRLDNFLNWELDILGEGSNLHDYERLIEEENIINVNLLGKQDPYDYYLRSKILLMTSSAEGFPNVLLEAKQLGCVPIVFNSFASVYDIIEDGHDGFIISNNDIDSFYSSLLKIMLDQDMQKKMSLNAAKSSSLFSPDNIGNQWYELLLKYF